MPRKKKTILTPLTEEIARPAKWFRNVKRKNAKRKIKWTVNKEEIFKHYTNQYYVVFETDQEKMIFEEHRIPIDQPIKECHSRILVLPDGKVITPIRQFCEMKILPPDIKEAFFYNFENIVPADPKHPMPKITSRETDYSKKESEHGTRIDIGYTEVSESSIDIISACNRSFALESVNDENKEILNRCVNGHRIDNWINHKGLRIIDDSEGLGAHKGNMSMDAIFKAKEIIEDEGLESKDAILATSGKAIRDLILDPNLDYYWERYNENNPENTMERPAIITQAIVEKLMGIKIIRSSAVSEYGKELTRSIMFLPNISFGLVTSRDLTMEAKKKLRPKVVQVTGIERLSGLIKVPESVVRISHV